MPNISSSCITLADWSALFGSANEVDAFRTDSDAFLSIWEDILLYDFERESLV